MENPPFLLTSPTHDGTLAAARCLGQLGIPVTMAGDRLELSAPARWSKYVTRWESAPSPHAPRQFVDWLVAFGRRNPGHVLYPTSDGLAWLLAEHAPELSPFYQLYQPGPDSLLSLLDKGALKSECDELEIPTPSTLFPRSERDALEGARKLGYPVLLKPRTQVLQHGGSKGHVARTPEELRLFYGQLIAGETHAPLIKERIFGVHHPMLQAYSEAAAERVYSISGFLTHDGQMVARAANKVLQRPRRVGVGICFESAPVEPQALMDVFRLCQAHGYYGVFEVEFLHHDGQLKLIDFNPRFYGQMAFDIGRESPLPYLVWLAAQRRDVELREHVARAQAWEPSDSLVYCNRFTFALMLTMQGLSGRMTAAEVTGWREWLRRSQDSSAAIDAMHSPTDVVPGLVSAARELCRALRHPRAFYRQVVVGGVLPFVCDIESLELVDLLTGFAA